METGESVNALEARAEWAVFCKLKVPLHLYVPPTSVDTARRLCAEYDIPVAEVWTFHITFDQVRFTMIHRSDAPVGKGVTLPSPKPVAKVKPIDAPLLQTLGGQATSPVVKVVAKPAAKVVPRPVAKPTPATKPKPGAKAKPAAKAKAKAVVKAKAIVKAKAPVKAKASKPAKKSKPASKKRR